jgi:hypothetical protein
VGGALAAIIQIRSMKTRLFLLSFMFVGFSLTGQTIYLKIGPTFSKLTWKNSMVNKAHLTKELLVLMQL